MFFLGWKISDRRIRGDKFRIRIFVLGSKANRHYRGQVQICFSGLVYPHFRFCFKSK